LNPLVFDFILKPVGGKCNLRCSYCYYLQRPKQDLSAVWSLDDANLVIHQIAELEKSRNNKQARVTWHGGEPLLAGIDWYKAVRQFQSETGIEFINSIQTNGTLINNGWIDLFKKMNITVGLSIDGPVFLHDRQRCNKNGRGVLDKVLRSLNLCRNNGIRTGVLCVITNYSSDFFDEIISFFLENEIHNFDFLPAYGVSVDKSTYSVIPAKYSAFMKQAFDWYLQYDNPDIKIRTIVTVIERLLGCTGGVCTVSGKSCGRFITIEGNGDISFCDDYNADLFPVLGNIKYSTLSGIVSSQQFQFLRDSTLSRSSAIKKCSSCEVKILCNGGCQRNWIGDDNFFCDFYKDFYLHVYKRLCVELAENTD